MYRVTILIISHLSQVPPHANNNSTHRYTIDCFPVPESVEQSNYTTPV